MSNSKVANPLMRIREVSEVTTLSTASVYRLMSQGQFPKPIKVMSNRVAWRSSDVQAYLANLGA